MTAATFVLVHGAFHGGWCWRPVASGLRALGHEVHTPTQTGLGERRHLLGPDITMETFVQDIVQLIEMEELGDVVLVGHSFGARTALGVADRIPHRLRRLVLIDGGIPFDGASRLEAMSPQQREERLVRAVATGGVGIAPPPAASFGVSDPALLEWLERHLTPQPVGAENTRLALTHDLGNGLPVSYVRCTSPALAVVDASADYARAREDWSYVEVAAGHSVIVTDPDWVVAYLDALTKED